MNKIKQCLLLIICSTIVFLSNYQIYATPENTNWEGTLIAEVFDYGTDITKIIIDTKTTIQKESVSIDSFRVSATLYSTDNTFLDEVIFDGNRTITNIYPANENGEKQEEGQYLVLELEHGYQMPGCSIINYSSGLNYPLRYQYVVTLEEDISINQQLLKANTTIECENLINPSIDKYSFEVSESDIQYRLFSPEEKENKPLIIWLHGGAEGGNNNTVQLLASKSGAALASPQYQEIFDSAYVFIPQCPTYWSLTNMYGNAIWLEPLKETIQEVLNNNPDIDKERIYIGGASAGGFMTWQLIVDDPNFYAAAILSSSAYTPTDDDMNAVKDLPIWVIHSQDDNVVAISVADQFVENLKQLDSPVIYTRLNQLMINDVQYDGHWTFISVFNNLPTTENDISIFEWLASQQNQRTEANSSNRTTYISIGMISIVIIVGSVLIVYYIRNKRKA